MCVCEGLFLHDITISNLGATLITAKREARSDRPHLSTDIYFIDVVRIEGNVDRSGS